MKSEGPNEQGVGPFLSTDLGPFGGRILMSRAGICKMEMNKFHRTSYFNKHSGLNLVLRHNYFS